MNLDRAIRAPRSLTRDEIAELLRSDDAGLRRALFAAAAAVRRACGKDRVLPRGLIECSNVCAKDCLYCGIRRGNAACERYRLTEDEIVSCCAEAWGRGYPAVAFQAGEIESEANTALYERLIRVLTHHAGRRPRFAELTLSLGEQEESVYRRWKEAAGDAVLRYLIRIETSDRDLYARIHPPACSFDRRLGCIRTLKRLGYVTGSGVMIGLPGQTIESLAADVVFFGDEDLDMVGMGPYVAEPSAPLAARPEPFSAPRKFELALRMIAVTRLYMHGINIVAATALEALDADGRAKGLAAGANVVMPNLTPPAARARYSLYPGKSEAVS